MAKRIKRPQRVTHPLIPLFPSSWIKAEVGFSSCTRTYELPENFTYQHTHVYDPADVVLEPPNDGSDEALGLLKEVSRRGGDPNYVSAAMWYYSDFYNRSFEWVKLKDADALKVDESIKAIQLAASHLNPFLRPATKEQLASVLALLKKELPTITKDEKGRHWRSAVYLPAENALQKNIGRSADTDINMMVLLLFRHLKTSLKKKHDIEKGPYTLTGEILSACFPERFGNKPDRKTIEARIHRLEKDHAYTKECKDIEERFSGIGNKFIKIASEKKLYDQIMKAWFPAGLPS